MKELTFVRDIRSASNLISIEAKIQKTRFVWVISIHSFYLKKVKNASFEHRREFRFTDKYNQTWQLILHEDPTAIYDDEKSLTFILYEGKTEGRVFISRESNCVMRKDDKEFKISHASGNTISDEKKENKIIYSKAGIGLVHLSRHVMRPKTAAMILLRLKLTAKAMS